ncbi:MAG: glycosyltransferase [Pseudomonadota bacterium]
MKTIVLYSAYSNEMSYFDDWVDTFKEHTDYQSECINVFQRKGDLIDTKKKIQQTELVVLHHSMNGDTLKYLRPFVSALKNRKGKLVSFVGNEINLPTIGMASKIKILQKLEPEIIATQLLQEAGNWLYADCIKSRVISLPHALNPNAFYPTTDLENRKIDIGTRLGRYGVHVGDNDRNNLIQYFHQNSIKWGLSIDLGLDKKSQKRFNRKEWAQFLNFCKATMSTEAGSLYLERDDRLVQNIQKYLKKKSDKLILPPDETILRKMYQKIVPSLLRQKFIHLLKKQLIEVGNVDQDADFQEIYQKFFSQKERCPVYSKAISSRHFDAIGTKTLNIMYPGRYNDILKSNEHFFELKRDHSNIEELLSLINNPTKLNEITGHAWEHIHKNHTHKNRLDTLLSFL